MLKKPLIFIDLETTGTDVSKDKIVQLSCVKYKQGFEQDGEFRDLLMNPGILIPEAATLIHGKTNEMVKDKPTFSQYSKSMLDYFSGCNFAGHNILDFDIPLLIEEFGRCGITFPLPGMMFFDTIRIMTNKVPRTLDGASRFYLGKPVEDAHDAFADTKATIDIFKKQLEVYPDLNEMSEEELSVFCKGEATLDFAGKFKLNDKGEAIFAFGQHNGKPVKENKHYCDWMLNPAKSTFTTETRSILRYILSLPTNTYIPIKSGENG